jgi:hypothetical protein
MKMIGKDVSSRTWKRIFLANSINSGGYPDGALYAGFHQPTQDASKNRWGSLGSLMNPTVLDLLVG